MFKEFREFALKGNVVDLAVGVIIGAAFGKITTSLVNDIIMPPIGLLLGKGGLWGQTIRCAPPMNIARSDADFILAVLDEAIGAV